MKKFFNVLLASWLVLTINVAFAETPSPMPMLNTTAEEVTHALQENKNHLTIDLVHKIVNQYLIPHVDIYGMARSALGRNAWNQATDAQKKEFSQQFIDLVVRTYSSPLVEYTDEQIRFLPIRGGYEGKSFLSVMSLIVRSTGNNVPVSYSLVLIQGEWKVYDMSVEGVSLLQSFRSQFAQELTSGSLDKLIENMKKHNQQKSQAA